MKETTKQTVIPFGIGGLRPEEDDIDPGAFDCMRSAGAGLIWTLQGGVPTSRLLGAPSPR